MNVSTAAVVGELNAMLAMRSELMSQYGTPKDYDAAAVQALGGGPKSKFAPTRDHKRFGT